jgi:Na+/H+ antiporter NhaD/arsenite permease-like protein
MKWSFFNFIWKPFGISLFSEKGICDKIFIAKFLRLRVYKVLPQIKKKKKSKWPTWPRTNHPSFFQNKYFCLKIWQFFFWKEIFLATYCLKRNSSRNFTWICQKTRGLFSQYYQMYTIKTKKMGFTHFVSF